MSRKYRAVLRGILFLLMLAPLCLGPAGCSGKVTAEKKPASSAEVPSISLDPADYRPEKKGPIPFGMICGRIADVEELPPPVTVEATPEGGGRAARLELPGGKSSYCLTLRTGVYEVRYRREGRLTRIARVEVKDRKKAVKDVRLTPPDSVKSAEKEPVEKIPKRMPLKDKIRFPAGGSDPPADSLPFLARLAKIVNARREKIVKIVIEGHAAPSDDREEAVKLSLLRAEKVRDFLVYRGVPPEKLEVAGHGDSKPLLNDDGAVDVLGSDRVEFIFISR